MLIYNFDEILIDSSDTTCFSTKFNSKVLPTEHGHDFYELIFPIENSVIHVLNGKAIQMEKYMLCLITPSDTHYTEQVKNQTPSYFTISIKAEQFIKISETISKTYFSDSCKLHYTKVNSQVFEQCKRYLFKLLFSSPLEAKMKQQILSIVVTKLLTEFPTHLTHEPQFGNLFDRAIQLMRTPENMRLSVKDIAEKLEYSQEHLIRSFKKLGYETPNKVFTKIKLDYSIELLCSTDYSISEISEFVGFFSPLYFNQKFKSFYGVLPNKYRKEHEKLF